MKHCQQSKPSLGEQLIQQVLDKLATTIITLESDQILQQMRNDPTLYEYKINRIKEVIETELNFAEVINEAMDENEKIRMEKERLEECVERKNQEFAEELDKIEESAKEHTKLKEREFIKLTQILAYEKEKYVKLQNQMRQKDSDFHRLQQTLKKNQAENCQSKKGLEKVQHVLQRYETDHEETIQHMQNQFRKQTEEYESVISKMQNDMNLIKNQWQKKCSDVENQLRNSYRNQLIALQEKKNKELDSYIESCKQGKPIVIKEDSQLANSKMQMITQQYESQISDLKQKCVKLGIVNLQLENELNRKSKQFYLEEEKYKAQIKGCDSEYKLLESDNEKNKETVERVKKENELLKSRMEEMNRRVKEYQVDEDKLKSELKDFQIECERAKGEKERFRKDIQNLKSKSADYLHEIRQNNLQTESREAELMKVKDELKFIQKKLQIASRNLSQEKQETRRLEKSQKEQGEEILELKKVIKNNNKEIQEGKQKVSEMVMKLKEQELKSKELDKKSQDKMAQMIDEFEKINEKDHEEFENLDRENERIRRELRRCELLLNEKDKEIQIVRDNAISSEIQQVKRICLNEVSSQRQRFQRLLEDYQRKERQHHIILEQTKNQVKDVIRLTMNKWGGEISRLEEEIKKKDRQLYSFSQKLQLIVNECEEIKKSQEYDHEDAKKMRKRYESLKIEKEEKIQDLLKRLEKQSKHKLALEKQLRSIRSEVNKIHPTKNLHSYESMPSERENKNHGNTDREKELSEIRELIAKTYKAVGEKPESDNRWKKLH